MEKCNSNPSEKAQEIYHEPYLDLEIGDTIEFGKFSNFDCQYRNTFEDRKFKVWHKLTNDHTIQYVCRFKNFETAKSLYEQLDDADECNFGLLKIQLNEQEVEIVNKSIV